MNWSRTWLTWSANMSDSGERLAYKETGVVSMDEHPAIIDNGWRVIRPLGEGWEGVAHLVEDKATSRRWVFKSFHRPLPADRLHALQIYQAGILAQDCPGLRPIELIWDGDRALGVRYPHVALYNVQWRVLRRVERVGQVMVDSYCRFQHHLISRHGIAIWDAHPENFMLSRDGHYYWTDFGRGFEVAKRPTTGRTLGGFEYSFVTLLLGIYGINFKLLAGYSESYTYDGPCIYFMNPALDDVASQHQWVRDIVEAVRSQRADAFLEPEFYQQIGAQLPNRVLAPAAVVAMSALLSRGGQLRARLRNS